MSFTDLADFVAVVAMLLVVVLALGWARGVVARRGARLEPGREVRIPRPFEASADSMDPMSRQPGPGLSPVASAE